MRKSSVYQIVFVAFVLLAANLCAFAKDDFVSVSTRHFKFFGEADEEKILREALRLEQFREAVRRAFPELEVAAPQSPTVLIFRDAESFAPYKPVREDGLADRSVSGFFQSSDEASYIAFSAPGEGETSPGTIYHEYVHFLIKNNFSSAALPVWLNEGLAEYFQTFRLKNDRRAFFGEPQRDHVRLLRQYRLIPLERLAAVDYASLARMDRAEKNLFYAQSWAAVHYLMQKHDRSIVSLVKKHLKLLAGGRPPEEAFREVFRRTYSETESELEHYVSKRSFRAREFDLGEKLDFAPEAFEAESLERARWLESLGDLLFQSQRYDRAAEIFKQSLALDENSVSANLALGKVFLRQEKTLPAASQFEKALALDAENYAANYHLAFILFRKNVAEDGFIDRMEPHRAARIRELLKKAVARRPQLTEAYKMLASISLVNDLEVGETIGYLEKALEIEPQNYRLRYNLAQLYLRRKDFGRARQTALELGANCIEKDFCERVKSFLDILGSIEDKERELAELRKRYGLDKVDLEAENLLPPEEALNRALNRSLRKPLENESRFAGRLTEIACGKTVYFKIEGDEGNLTLSKPSFDGIHLISFSSNTAGMRIECGRPKTEMRVVATYKTDPAKADADGELFILEFVPREFKLIE